LLDALVGALDGTGPAVSPGPAVADEVPEQVAVVVRTSGSTGDPRGVMLDAAALRASADATAARLSGHGRWLLALPPEHVAGLQVLVRSVIAGTTPVVAQPGPFRAAGFVADAARLGGGPRYTSLVPTQLVRLLDDAEATAALAEFDAVLIGGAATPAPVLDAARAAGVRVVTTYGMSETCGGCVYDGVPLDGVQVTVADGLVHVAGPVLARGYLARPDLDARAFVVTDGVRRLRTSDVGRVDDGRLTVLGRADDVIVTGGVKVAPAAVEDVIVRLPGVAEACVVGVPDDEWGHVVVAAVVVSGPAPTLDQVRTEVAARLGAAHAPRRLVVLDALPHRGPGKHDRRALATMLTETRSDTLPDPSDRRIPT
jgi:O-succinylbenzoic acid--CoA ligase